MNRFLSAFLSVIFLLALAGCSGGNEPVTISVASPFHEDDGNRLNFTNAYKQYESATGNTVEDLASVSNEEWKAKIQTDFDSGNEPDVLFYFTADDANVLIANNQLVPISEIRSKYPEYAGNMKDSMLPVSTGDGRQYAIPVNGYWEGLYVNKRVLEECGVELPGADYTWEQFLLDCESVKSKGFVPIACSLLDVPHYWFEFSIFNHGNVVTHSDIPQTAGDAAAGKWASGLNDIKTLYDSGFLPEDTLTASDNETSKLMIENKAAFMPDGSWKIGWFKSGAADINDFTVTYMPAMGERKATDIIGGLSMGYYITRQAWDDPKKQKACVDFVTAMTTDEVVASFGGLLINALNEAISPPDDADALTADALKMVDNCTGIAPAVQDSLAPTARDGLFSEIVHIAAGEITPEAAVEKFMEENVAN